MVSDDHSSDGTTSVSGAVFKSTLRLCHCRKNVLTASVMASPVTWKLSSRRLRHPQAFRSRSCPRPCFGVLSFCVPLLLALANLAHGSHVSVNFVTHECSFHISLMALVLKEHALLFAPGIGVAAGNGGGVGHVCCGRLPMTLRLPANLKVPGTQP